MRRHCYRGAISGADVISVTSRVATGTTSGATRLELHNPPTRWVPMKNERRIFVLHTKNSIMLKQLQNAMYLF